MRARVFTWTASAARRPAHSSLLQHPWVCRICKANGRWFSSQTAPEVPSAKPFYITTPIFYVNAAPHVGHLYTMVLADVIKRWHQLKGEKAILSTGTDEHGLKVQKAAETAGIHAKVFCDEGAAIFQELAEKAYISNDHFVRTTDQDHKDAVQYAWFLLQEKGYIYMRKHEGWYSVRDEAFYPESGVRLYLEPSTGKKIMSSIETGSPVEWSSETNYHFRLSAFREPLLEFYKNNPEWIKPESRMREVVQEVESGLADLSISRPSERLNWGIRVPDDDSQTIYVWLDALLNYAVKAGYPWPPGSELAGGWPADCHVIGKDIVRFHCIYWPAFLMALGLPLPKNILTHAHWTLGRAKMSKSTGTVVDPFLALERFSADVMRFYLTHEGGLQDDADYDNTRIILMHKKFLNGSLGNMTSRLVRNKRWSVRGAVERIGPLPIEEWEAGPGSRFYHNTLVARTAKIMELMDAYDPRQAAQQIAELVRSANSFFQMSSPWEKMTPFGPGEPGEEVDRIVFLGAEAMRISGILLQPYMPTKAKMLLDQLGVHESRRTIEYCGPNLDLDYGVPMIDVGKGHVGALFPPLASHE
ncbi:methionyl-tRNA synthetase-like protein [Westerdykella ornata]|uniref:Probable methionine--tRNA ligase, mitochondrial n=1 Tax=Westerdykella ornata TaxID=318751 RepID=A0A6A6JXB6_WESOR|nr:methionyl-tRNA synthetase-like protein [Westerdykella ornata]KAF2280834.1 methionyl-tRNA synthetase-like protein [Westerdykella ornata]